MSVKEHELAKSINTSLYPNCWIAVVQKRVVGVGLTAPQAHRAARQTRPKDKLQLFFVNAEGKVEESDFK
jgi:hypothetical protein